MLPTFNVRKMLSRSANANPEDMLNLKAIMGGLGHYKVPKSGITPYPDRDLFKAVENFQRQNQLKVDGVLKPGGPTERALDKAFSINFIDDGKQVGGAIHDFAKNYLDMRKANTVGADKYFHCKANCEASKRGKAGSNTGKTLSDGREWFDSKIKGGTVKESLGDQAVNRYGRSGAAAHAGKSCSDICSKYRPKGLSPQY